MTENSIKLGGGKKKWFALAGTLVILLVLLLSVNLSQTFDTFRSMKPLPLLLAIALAVFASYIIGGYKWQRILAGLGFAVPFREILFVRLGGEPVKFVFPAKAGELIKPLYLKSARDVPMTESIGSLALDKIFNLAGLAVVFALAVTVTVGWVFGAAMLVLVALSVWLMHRFSKRLADWLEKKEGKIAQLPARLLRTLHGLSPKEALIQVLLGGLFLFSEVITGYLSLYAAGVPVSFFEAATALPIVIVMVQIPITISGIGTREAGMMLFFAPFAPASTLLAVGVAFTMVELIAPVLFGLPWLPSLLRKIEWKKNPAEANS